MRQSLRDITSKELLLLLGATTGGAFGVEWFTVLPLTVAGLSLCAWPKYADLLPRVWRAGAERAFVITLALSGLNALAAATAAFVFGHVVRWMWF